MPNTLAGHWLKPPAGDDFTRLRERLAEAGYTVKGILDRMGSIEMPTRRARNRPRLLHLASGDTPLDILIRLFMLGVPVTAQEASRAFGTAPIEPWIRAGLVEARGDGLWAPVRMTPHEHLMLVYDAPDAIERGASADIVLGMTGSSLLLLCSTIRRKVRRAVDMGTGCGVQAFLAAAHSDQVWALDCNPRAVNYTGFNARLNGIENVECLQGDGFEPVRGQTFDLIVTNPPFMISPRCRYQYRDSGLAGDEFCRRIVRQAPSLLNEGGFCHLTLEWIHYKGRDYKERMAEWFEGSGCDAWIIRTETENPVTYADHWIRDTEQDDADLWESLFREYLDYYEREGIEAISAGYIAMRRATGHANWLRFDDAPPLKPEPFGDMLALGFELRDFLDAHRNDEDMMREKFRVSPDLRLDQVCVPDAGRWRVGAAQFHLLRGLEFKGNIDAHVAGLVARCDGTRELGELIRDAAQSLGADPAKVAAAFLTVIRQLIERGFILPAAWKDS